ALQRPVAEGVDLLIEAGADPRDLALRDPQPERLAPRVDLPGRDAGDVCLLHDRHQRLLASAPRLEKAWEVAAAAQLRNRELDLACPCLPRPRPVTVAVREPL